MTEVGAPYICSLEAYEAMVEKEDRELMGGVDPHRRIQHLFSIIEVLKAWVSASESFRNGSGNANGALTELTRAVSSGGLVSRIDSYKASLEGMLGGRDSDDVSQAYEALVDIDSRIKTII